jgi:hypothetical protein
MRRRRTRRASAGSGFRPTCAGKAPPDARAGRELFRRDHSSGGGPLGRVRLAQMAEQLGHCVNFSSWQGQPALCYRFLQE